MTPLAKRLPRELRRNIGKYLGIFLLMCGSIALTSGFLLAAHSIGCLIDDMRNAYTIEDGRVTTSFELPTINSRPPRTRPTTSAASRSTRISPSTPS